MDIEETKGIILREKEKSLFMSRVPKITKEEFTQFANEEFCEDYGMAFKHVWDNFKLWKILFENVNMKIDTILEKISRLEQKEQIDEVDKIKTLSGRELKGGKEK